MTYRCMIFGHKWIWRWPRKVEGYVLRRQDGMCERCGEPEWRWVA